MLEMGIYRVSAANEDDVPNVTECLPDLTTCLTRGQRTYLVNEVQMCHRAYRECSIGECMDNTT